MDQEVLGVDASEKQSHLGHGTMADTAVEQTVVMAHPQLVSDHLDPLSWSRIQKHTILGIVMLK